MNTDLDSHIICVGAVYIDTILTVPHFPIEDEKLRAKAITRRRGGNTANTLEVLSQLLEHDPTSQSHRTSLQLLAVLPDEQSSACNFIQGSLPGVDVAAASLFREGHQEAASSYIIQSQDTRSRTIVSINELPEMHVDEFRDKVQQIIQTPANRWFHFEGRVPEITLQCVQFLRKEYTEVKISVECEKPERTGMAEVAKFADVVFYSRLWAQKNGYENAKSFLEAQRAITRDGALLCCTWGAGGATAVKKGPEETWADVEAWQPKEGGQIQVIDTIGAGDTFIAGMLFTLDSLSNRSLWEMLEFANRLAGQKVSRDGFGNLGRDMWF